MKKTILLAVITLMTAAVSQKLNAQSTFTADLQPFFRDNVDSFTVGLADTITVSFSVVNHGPDNIDTSDYIYYGINGLPPQYFMLVQTESGDPQFLDNGDTIDDRGIFFTNGGTWERDTTFQFCFFMKNNSWPDSFIYDPNPLNDTLCFWVTYKKNDSLTSIARILSQVTPLKIVPNPASDLVYIPLVDFRDQAALLKVYSIDGRLVHTEKVKAGNADNIRIDVRAWHKGMYLVEVQSESLLQRGRFTVQ